MFVGFWEFEKDSLLAGLLLFRLFYYIVPFALALAIVGIREFLLDVHVLHPPDTAPPVASELARAEPSRRVFSPGHSDAHARGVGGRKQDVN
jgi:hypothetical protein